MVNSTKNGFVPGCTLLAIFMFVFGVCNAKSLPECPQTISVLQATQAAPDGWEQVPYSGSQRLARITFRLRSDTGELRPDEEKVIAGKQTLIWNVDGMTELEQICVYAGTLARLSRSVSGVVHRCEVREAKTPAGSLRITSECQ
jgi:hypothetical protein